MEEKGEIKEALKDIKNIAENNSWFRYTLHYWAEASLPLAYAVERVEVVSKMSGEAGYSSGQCGYQYGSKNCLGGFGLKV